MFYEFSFSVIYYESLGEWKVLKKKKMCETNVR